MAASLVLHAGLLIVSLVCSIVGLMKWNNDTCRDGEVELFAGLGCLCLGSEVVLAAVQSGYTETAVYICPGFFVAAGLLYLLLGVHKLRAAC